jgi:hypothetical protein
MKIYVIVATSTEAHLFKRYINPEIVMPVTIGVSGIGSWPQNPYSHSRADIERNFQYPHRRSWNGKDLQRICRDERREAFRDKQLESPAISAVILIYIGLWSCSKEDDNTDGWRAMERKSNRIHIDPIRAPEDEYFSNSLN